MSTTAGHARTPDWEEMGTERQVLELRMSGLSWAYIARELNLSESAVRRCYAHALDLSAHPDLAELRDVEALRLDRLQLAAWPQALRGDLPSIDRVLRIMERRARLLGLDHSDGVAERQMRLNEQTGGMVVNVIARVLEGLALTDEQRRLADEVVPRELRAVARVVPGEEDAAGSAETGG